jgi:hypothetical protein
LKPGISPIRKCLCLEISVNLRICPLEIKGVSNDPT